MRVVLSFDGLSMRMQEYSEAIPKPMVTIGYRPIRWNVMKYYAGTRSKNCFVEYDECMSSDFGLSQEGKNLALLSNDIHQHR
jgi:glucose-1-phosphate cytidylyltransferase